MQESIYRIPTNNPRIFAFEINGKAQAEDLQAMAEVMLDAFSRYDKVNMLLIFRPYDGGEIGGAFDLDVIKAQFSSLSSVRRYAVVDAPEYARTMIEFLDKLSPVRARTFDRSNEAAAWEYVGEKQI